MHIKKIVIIGSGAVGCGFIGQLAHSSGYETVFVDSDLQIVNQLNRTGSYQVQLVTGDKTQKIIVNGVKAIPITESELVIKEISEASLVATAVGPRNLPNVASFISAGIRKRRMPLNILAFENLPNAGSLLRDMIARRLPKDFPSDQYGLSGVVVSRVVSRKMSNKNKDDRLIFLGDTASGFVVNGEDLCRPLPALKGIVFDNLFSAYMTRKLCTFSAGHATCAYLGSLKGYQYIHDAIQDPDIRSVVFGAMAEGQRGLKAIYGRFVAGTEKHLYQILHRYENPALNDPISRVGRDPSRKLSSKERLVMAARLAEYSGVRPNNLALGIGAAFHFYDQSDEASIGLQKEVKSNGLGSVLPKISAIQPTSPMGKLITQSWELLGSPHQSIRFGELATA